MILRSLPLAEWNRLHGLDVLPLLAQTDPSRVEVLAVEQDNEIIGCWAFLWMPHAEGVWIHPAYRGKTSVARQLWRGMQQLAARFKVSRLVTGACDPVIAQLLQKHGAWRVLADTYVLPMKGRS